jgi:hypothetical protein
MQCLLMLVLWVLAGQKSLFCLRVRKGVWNSAGGGKERIDLLWPVCVWGWKKECIALIGLGLLVPDNAVNSFTDYLPHIVRLS